MVQCGNAYQAWAVSSRSYLASAHPMAAERHTKPTLHSSMHILSSALQPNSGYIRYSPDQSTVWPQATADYALPVASTILPPLHPAEAAPVKLHSQSVNPLSPIKNETSPMRLILSTRLTPIASVSISMKPILPRKPTDSTESKLVRII